MPPLWIILANAAAIAATGLLTWLFWRLHGGGGDGSNR
jgi:hypothetical protein